MFFGIWWFDWDFKMKLIMVIVIDNLLGVGIKFIIIVKFVWDIVILGKVCFFYLCY